jgi:hypothetical protein
MVQRDRALESLIADKVAAARRYYRRVLNEFDRAHALPGKLIGEFGPADDLAAPPWTDATPAKQPAAEPQQPWQMGRPSGGRTW